jgi:oxidase EvaA|tara:strand:+ start:1384 stop:1983 length:600 start_codon:yes stop_codon:yes gene_type:complete
MKHLEKWLLNQKKINKIKIKRKNLDRLENWIISHKKIYHITKKFFQIIGIRVTSNFNKKTWDQPIMVQNENGILGIIRKKFNNDYKYLLQAKPEPGNINDLQLSPTVQATESNYKQVHGGKKTKYLEYFVNKKFLIKSKQSEQGLRYLNKFNTNYLVEIKKKLKLSNNFKWFSKSELLYLIKKKKLTKYGYTISFFMFY